MPDYNVYYTNRNGIYNHSILSAECMSDVVLSVEEDGGTPVKVEVREEPSTDLGEHPASQRGGVNRMSLFDK